MRRQGFRHRKPKKKDVCEGKIPYAFKNLADDAAFALKRQQGGQIRAYRCSFCFINVSGNKKRPWHIGHYSTRYWGQS